MEQITAFVLKLLNSADFIPTKINCATYTDNVNDCANNIHV